MRVEFGSLNSVTQSSPIWSVGDPLGEDVGETDHVRHGEREAAALPRDVDPGVRAMRERDGARERRHPVGERPLGRVEEDADEGRPKGHHLALERRKRSRGPADVRVDVLIELDAEPVEGADAERGREDELGLTGGPRHAVAGVDRRSRERRNRERRKRPDQSPSSHCAPLLPGVANLETF